MRPPSADPLAGRIRTVRGRRVVLDADLARLYGVRTGAFNQAVRRNAARFPEDFAFQLTREEMDGLETAGRASAMRGDREVRRLMSQSVTSSGGRGGSRKRPWAFTEHGAVMAANLLRSPRAVAMSVLVVRAFVRMREALAANQAVLRRLAEIDRTLLEHDAALRTLWERLRPLLAPPPERPAKEMGFHTRLPRK